MREPVCIAGPTSSGKTTLLLGGLGAFERMGKKCMLLTTELTPSEAHDKLEQMGETRMRMYLPILQLEAGAPWTVQRIVELVTPYKIEILAIDELQHLGIGGAHGVVAAATLLAAALGADTQLWYSTTVARGPRKLKAA